MCELYDQSSKSFEIYCENYIRTPPENSSIKTHQDKLNKNVPIQSEPDVVALRIRGCESNTVLDTIRRFQNVKFLDISHSGFGSLNWFDLRLDGLEKINASHNKITEISTGFFNKMPNLIEVDLSHNAIEKIESNLFEGAPKLQQIHLAHNKIPSLEGDHFGKMKDLKFLDLSNNSLTDVPRAFPDSEDLIVNMQNTKIGGFGCVPYRAQISFASLQNLNTICPEFRYHVVRNSGKEGIFGVSPKSYEIHCSDQSFGQLSLFKAGSNALDNLEEIYDCLSPALRSLHFMNNAIGKMNSTILDKFPNLEWLTLHNASLTEFDFAMFKYPSEMMVIQMSHNNLKHLKNIQLLKSFESLRTLKMAENQLENVPEIIENIPLSVDSLDLSGNYVGQLNASTFAKFKSLSRLRMDNANLIFPDLDPFEECDKLYFLDISHNNLERMDFSVLSPTLNRLRKFHAIGCNIHNISSITEYLGASVHVLDLSENSFEHLNADAFKSLVNLRSLLLGNANILNFDIDFRQHQSLRFFNITYNKLEKLDVSLMPQCLITLYVRGNELTEVSNLSRERFPNLRWLSMGENRFSCEYLRRFSHDWQGIRFFDNQWQQKEGEDCQPNDQPN